MINNRMIAIDARMIEMSGIGTYIQHLMGQGIYDYALGKEEEIRKYDKEVNVIPYDAPIYSVKEQLCFPNREVRRAGIQLIHFPHYNVPISYRGEFVVTVHDLTHIIKPEFLGNKIKYWYAKFLMSNALRNSKHIYTVSENSKNDICRIFNIDQNKTSITYDAVDSLFRKKDNLEVKYLYEKYKIPHDKILLLYVGNLKTHKNLSNLLKALAYLKDKENYCLILAGKAFISLDLNEQEKQLGIEQLVIHTGLVSKDELIDLYNLADLFVFPSLYEGFGIPPLEAMACGTAVVASNSSSIPEVVGAAAEMFNPEDIDDIAQTIKKVSTNQCLCDRLIEKGLQQYKKFQWNDTVNEVKSQIERIITNGL